LLTSNGQQFAVSNVTADDDKDLALLHPIAQLPGSPLAISTESMPVFGAQVSTWGYPGGYDGLLPLLSVGYLSGTQEFSVVSRPSVRRWVINAAFNGGNSGGPVLSVEDGRVIGVVSSKLAPLPESIAQILKVLSAQRAILQYERVNADGTKVSLSEGQIVAEVLNYLRSQVQLVIGYSVTTQDLNQFLNANGVAP
jgi:S1-C subfamily serine protease